MSLELAVSALIRATDGLDMPSRHDAADVSFSYSRGAATVADLTDAAETFIQDLDDRSMSGTPEWQAVADHVERVRAAA